MYRRPWTRSDAYVGTGTNLTPTLYDQMKHVPVDVGRVQLWVELGVIRDPEQVLLDDDAPMSAVRRSVAARRPEA